LLLLINRLPKSRGQIKYNLRSVVENMPTQTRDTVRSNTMEALSDKYWLAKLVKQFHGKDLNQVGSKYANVEKVVTFNCNSDSSLSAIIQQTVKVKMGVSFDSKAFLSKLTSEQFFQVFPTLKKTIHDQWLSVLLEEVISRCKWQSVARAVKVMLVDQQQSLSELMPLDLFPYTTNGDPATYSTYSIADVLNQFQSITASIPPEGLIRKQDPTSHVHCKKFRTRYKQCILGWKSARDKFTMPGVTHTRTKTNTGSLQTIWQVAPIPLGLRYAVFQQAEHKKNLQELLEPLDGLDAGMNDSKYNCTGSKLPPFSKCACPSSAEVMRFIAVVNGLALMLIIIIYV
jgi:hypothetical protein